MGASHGGAGVTYARSCSVELGGVCMTVWAPVEEVTRSLQEPSVESDGQSKHLTNSLQHSVFPRFFSLPECIPGLWAHSLNLEQSGELQIRAVVC